MENNLFKIPEPSISEVPSQILKISELELPLYNREYMSSDDNPLGYKKEYISLSNMDRVYQKIIVSSIKDRPYYKLSWDLLLSEEKFIILNSIQNMVIENLMLDLEQSSQIYGPTIIVQSKNLELYDNRVVDFVSGAYKKYNINITNISSVEEFFIKEKLVKFKLEAETL